SMSELSRHINCSSGIFASGQRIGITDRSACAQQRLHRLVERWQILRQHGLNEDLPRFGYPRFAEQFLTHNTPDDQAAERLIAALTHRPSGKLESLVRPAKIFREN